MFYLLCIKVLCLIWCIKIFYTVCPDKENSKIFDMIFVSRFFQYKTTLWAFTTFTSLQFSLDILNILLIKWKSFRRNQSIFKEWNWYLYTLSEILHNYKRCCLFYGLKCFINMCINEKYTLYKVYKKITVQNLNLHFSCNTAH